MSSGFLATASTYNPCAINLWDAQSFEMVSTIKCDLMQGISGLCFSSDSSLIAASFSAGTIVVWEVSTSKEIVKLPNWVALSANSLNFNSSNSKLLATCLGVGGVILIWDLATNQCVQSVRMNSLEVPVNAVFNRYDDRIFSIGNVNVADDVLAASELLVIDSDNGSLISRTQFDFDGRVTGIAVCPAGGSIACRLAFSNSIIIVNPETARKQQVLESSLNLLRTGVICTACYNSAGDRIAGGRTDGIIVIWDISSGEELMHICSSISTEVQSMSFSASGLSIACGFEYSRSQMITMKSTGVIVYEVESGTEQRLFNRVAAASTSLCFSQSLSILM